MSQRALNRARLEAITATLTMAALLCREIAKRDNSGITTEQVLAEIAGVLETMVQGYADNAERYLRSGGAA